MYTTERAQKANYTLAQSIKWSRAKLLNTS